MSYKNECFFWDNNINWVYFLMVELILWENVKNIEFKIFVC